MKATPVCLAAWRRLCPCCMYKGPHSTWHLLALTCGFLLQWPWPRDRDRQNLAFANGGMSFLIMTGWLPFQLSETRLRTSSGAHMPHLFVTNTKCQAHARKSEFVSRDSDWLQVGVRAPVGGKIFLSTSPERLWGPSNRYPGLFPPAAERLEREASDSSNWWQNQVELYFNSPHTTSWRFNFLD
jgi:hypothetical protein